jgi:formamidopyrimidine-DNA glycosylase
VPELPDLQYIVLRLAPRIADRRIDEVAVREPIVIRMLLPGAGGFVDALPGRAFTGLRRHGPFLVFDLTGEAQLVIHCMLAGRLQIAGPKEKPVGSLAFAMHLDNGDWLRYGDEKKMGKVYLIARGATAAIPGFDTQGVDVTSPDFTLECFQRLIAGRRQQVRVFLMDQTALSAVGNAYADEILFSAGIHPKTFCASLSPAERDRLHASIVSVMAWGIAEVEKAGEPIEVKVRGHVRVRGRKDQPCPACGTKIRRVGVLGYDAYFCPQCQPVGGPEGKSRTADRKHQMPW